MPAPRKSLADLAALREQLARADAERLRQAREAQARQQQAELAATEFARAVGPVTPIATDRRHHPVKPPRPEPRMRHQDNARVLAESLSDTLEPEALLDIDASLSYAAPGIGADVLRKLRRGEWTVQAEVDLHGHRVDEAREALAAFLREAIKLGLRCVRVVHGKGLGSAGKVPVLKGKVRSWLAQKDEVIAFVEPRGIDGGGGALIVLLRTSSPSANGK